MSLQKDFHIKTILQRIVIFRLSLKELREKCQELLYTFTDINFSCKDWKRFVREGSQEKGKNTPRMNSKVRGNATRKSPLYHNCQLQAPDGQVQFLFVTSNVGFTLKKVIWLFDDILLSVEY